MLMEFFDEALDFIHLLPLTLKLRGKPMDVANRRPMFAHLFRRQRMSASEIYLCGRQIAKTTSAAARIMMNLLWRLHFRILYVAPLQIYTQRLHQVHLNPFVQTCTLPWPVQDESCINNVNSKSFLSQSHYHGVSCFNSPANALGIAIDDIVYDEVQDLNFEFIPQIRETMRTSSFRWETFFGTARGVENTIQMLFDQSSGAEWHMRCGCGLWVVPTKEKHAISMIQPHGIACPDCQRLLDVSNGEWVHAFPARAQQFGGYHIPATIVRDVTHPIDSKDPHAHYLDTIYNKVHGIRKYSEAKVLNEILGISHDQGGRPITPEEIREASVLPFDGNLIRPQPHHYTMITGGADWGGSEQISFTVGTAIGFTPTGEIHVLGAVRPTGVPDNDRHLPLAAFFQRISQNTIQGVGADAGFVGGVQNRNLQRVMNVRTASIAYGTQKLFYRALPLNNFVVDRTTLIYCVYALIRNKTILLPQGEWFETFSNDLTATYIEDIEAPNGAINRRYKRYEQKADDFLHALGYAVFVGAVMQNMDLTEMVGLGRMSSLNAGFTEVAGEESGLPSMMGWS